MTDSDLIRALEVGGGILRLTDPGDPVRRAYRRAIYAARRSGAIPMDKRLELRGRDRGDLVIRLVSASDDSARAIPEPTRISDDALFGHESSQDLLHTAASLRMSGDARPRALRILQSWSEEATRRGHGVQLGAASAALAITIGRERFEFDLFEEDDVVDIVPEAELATKRFSWHHTPRDLFDAAVTALRSAVHSPKGISAQFLGEEYVGPLAFRVVLAYLPVAHPGRGRQAPSRERQVPCRDRACVLPRRIGGNLNRRACASPVEAAVVHRARRRASDRADARQLPRACCSQVRAPRRVR